MYDKECNFLTSQSVMVAEFLFSIRHSSIEIVSKKSERKNNK